MIKHVADTYKETQLQGGHGASHSSRHSSSIRTLTLTPESHP